MYKNKFSWLFLALAYLVTISAYSADLPDTGSAPEAAPFVETRISGFGEVTVGRLLDGSPTTGQGGSTPYTLSAKPGINYNCPCFISNFERAGIYNYKKTDIAPDSVLGVQGDFKFSPDFSATAQAVARGADRSVYMDWAYVSYRFNSSLTFQAGRKRSPLYYYSDFMYVGYDYPWVRTPQDLYAWQIFDYDGANLMYSTNLGSWSLSSNVWAGTRTTKDNTTLGNLYYSSKIEESWKPMVGAYIDATNNVIDARVVYMHTSVDRFAVAPDGTKSLVMSGENGVLVNGVGQAFYGVSLNADYKNWIVRSELNLVDRPSVKNTYTAQMYSGGYQLDKHTLMLTWSQFQERAKYWPTGVEKHSTQTLSYRYDFAPSQSFKLQYDKIKDESGWLFSGNASLLSASWQFVF